MRFFLAIATVLTISAPLPVQSQPQFQPQSQVSQTPSTNSSTHPDNRRLLEQGLTAQTAGQLAQAETAYRAAIQLNQKDSIAYYNLGNVLAEQSKFDEAIAAYRTAITLNPTNAKAHYNLGYWLSAQGQTQQAITAYRTAAQLSPFDADTYYNLSLLLSAQTTPTATERTEAEVMMNRAILLNPDYAL